MKAAEGLSDDDIKALVAKVRAYKKYRNCFWTELASCQLCPLCRLKSAEAKAGTRRPRRPRMDVTESEPGAPRKK